MLEAVGHEHLHSYFECVERYLKPGGLAAVQVITLPDDRYKDYCEQRKPPAQLPAALCRRANGCNASMAAACRMRTRLSTHTHTLQST